MTPDRALTVKQAAEVLGISYWTLYNMRARREGPPYTKIGGKVVYRERDLFRYIESKKTDPEKETA